MHSVLVVDDEPGMVNFAPRPGRPLRRAGQRWRRGLGRRAIAAPALRSDHSGYLLPGGRSGTQWLHELRGEGFAGDVVLMTAYADLDTAIDALRAGAADFLLKPFSLAQLLNAVKRCFERSRLQQENYVLPRSHRPGRAGRAGWPVRGDAPGVRAAQAHCADAVHRAAAG